MTSKKLLVVGASGIVGQAVLDHFTTLDDWEVLGLSRRAPTPPSTAPHISLDLTDRNACEGALSRISDITHVVYAALYEKPGLIKGWQTQDQMQTNLTMLRNFMEPLEAANPALEHVNIFQGAKAYGVHLHAIKVPAREDSPRDPHNNFYWLQQDYLAERQHGKDWRWSIHRPPIVFGHALTSPMNLLAAIGVYGALLREAGEPLHYPGGAPYVVEAVDARLLARACEWAATNPECGNQVFNITNGDVLVWPNVWPTIADALGMNVGETKPLALTEEMPKRSADWDRIVAKYDLAANSMEQLVGESFHYADFTMAQGRERPGPPIILSTIKARSLGFDDCMDTEEMFRYWFKRLQDLKILPPA